MGNVGMNFMFVRSFCGPSLQLPNPRFFGSARERQPVSIESSKQCNCDEFLLQNATSPQPDKPLKELQQ